MSKKNVIANRYEVVQHIGQGGMADVFRAVDTILNREVAIKILRSDLSTDAVSILRFEREAQAATALSHPNIVEVYDVGDYKGHHYIVMEYVRGQTLKQVIRNRGPLLIEETVDIMKQMCSAVAEAHARNIIHRDIKPQNIIVKADGSIKILDFGIATAKGSMQLTQANNVMGSVHYLAPELAKGEKASPQSDIYALGIVMFEMLAKDVPFKADQAVQVALKQLRDPFPDIRTINVMVPQSVANIITRATAKQPALRYRSCDEMLADLETCLNRNRLNEPAVVIRNPLKAGEAGEPRPEIVAQPPVQEMKPAPRAKKNVKSQPEPKNKRLLTWVIAIILIVVVLGGTFFGLVISGVIEFGDHMTEVPQIQGMTVAEARDICDGADLMLDTSNVRYVLTEDTEKGIVISAEPEVGTPLENGSKVVVTVSSGIGVRAPNFVGKKITEVEEQISRDYPMMTVNTLAEESDYGSGIIIRQEQLTAGTLFNPEIATQITLVYAKYHTIEIPENVIGMPVSDAVAYLEALNVVVRTSNRDTTQMSQEELEGLQIGVVVDVSPAVNTQYTQNEDNYIILYYY